MELQTKWPEQRDLICFLYDHLLLSPLFAHTRTHIRLRTYLSFSILMELQTKWPEQRDLICFPYDHLILSPLFAHKRTHARIYVCERIFEW